MNKMLEFDEYKNKVRACWLGKNIGGTLGAPFECTRGVYDLDYYTHDLKQGVLPNDDLDLQLVWLNAAEKCGKALTAETLGEYWVTYVVADWSEYGAGKNNLRFGLQPPVSGVYNNHNKNSCGCFIRSEIWACLAPGQPDIAVKYAREDAICDHAEEGLYAELFCAALQSAAFVEGDMNKLVEIGLRYIPKDCAIAGVVRLVFDLYKSGKTWKEARKEVLKKFPGTFGMYRGYINQPAEPDVPMGDEGYDVPSNIGIMMIGWLYGEGDFSKSICIAAGCCEDADCSAGTLAATLGIINGTSCIDEKWLEPIGDEIKTISVDQTKGDPMRFVVPNTVSELTDRVVKLMPTFMNGHFEFIDGKICIDAEGGLEEKKVKKGLFKYVNLCDEFCSSPYSISRENFLLKIGVEAVDGISVKNDKKKMFKLHIENKIRQQLWITVKCHMPADWTAQPGKEFSICLDQVHGGTALCEKTFSVVPEALEKAKYNITFEVTANGHPSVLYIPVTLVNDVFSEE